MNSSIDTIRQAIGERKHLQFSYHSLPRVVEPMRLGEVDHGRFQLRAHQVGGRPSTGQVADGTPKLFEIAEMSALSLIETSLMFLCSTVAATRRSSVYMPNFRR